MARTFARHHSGFAHVFFDGAAPGSAGTSGGMRGTPDPKWLRADPFSRENSSVWASLRGKIEAIFMLSNRVMHTPQSVGSASHPRLKLNIAYHLTLHHFFTQCKPKLSRSIILGQTRCTQLRKTRRTRTCRRPSRGEAIEVTQVRITDAGRYALKEYL